MCLMLRSAQGASRSTHDINAGLVRRERMRLEDKVALITGGASGMGASMARIFAREGAKVVVADVLDEDGRKVVADITQANGAAIFRHLDVTSEAEWKAAVDATIAEFGKLDILVNDARLSGSAVEDLFDTAAWDQLARQGDDHGLAGGTAAIGCLAAVTLRQGSVLLERATAMSRNCWPN